MTPTETYRMFDSLSARVCHCFGESLLEPHTLMLPFGPLDTLLLYPMAVMQHQSIVLTWSWAVVADILVKEKAALNSLWPASPWDVELSMTLPYSWMDFS